MLTLTSSLMIRRSWSPLLVWGTLLCAASAVPAEPLNVRALPLSDLLAPVVSSAPATVVARNEPEIAAETDGRVTEILVRVGDRVRPGETLARLDCRLHESRQAAAQARLDQATTAYRFASRQLVRARNLKKSKNISDELLDQRRTELSSSRSEQQSAEAALTQMGITVAQCRIEAPFDAVVRARLASVGDFARAGTPVLSLIERQGQEVSVDLRVEQLTTFREAAELSFVANGRKLPLTLRTIVPAADTRSHTREARLSFSAEGALPGTAGRVNWQSRARLLAAGYLVRRDGLLGVFTVDRDHARFVALPLAQEGRPAPVDLPLTTLIVSDGRQRLSDGDEVQVVDTGQPTQ